MDFLQFDGTRLGEVLVDIFETMELGLWVNPSVPGSKLPLFSYHRGWSSTQ